MHTHHIHTHTHNHSRYICVKYIYIYISALKFLLWLCFFFIFNFFVVFSYLAMPGLNWDLSCGMWDLVPWPGIEPGHWDHGVLVTGPPGKSWLCFWEVLIGVLLVKNPPANAGDARDAGLIPVLGRSPEEGNSNLFQCSCLENSMDRETWQAIVHGTSDNQTQLSD